MFVTSKIYDIQDHKRKKITHSYSKKKEKNTHTSMYITKITKH